MQRIRNSGPLVWITLGWAVGLVVGRSLGGPAGIYFTIAMAGALAGAGLYKWPKRAAVGWAMALIAAGGGWWTIRCTSDPLNLGPTEQRLIRVEGTIDQPPTFRLESGGLFGRFDHRPPATRLTLQVDRIHDGQTWRPIHTRLLVTIGEYDDRFSSGDRIRCGGRLRAIGPPLNPGQFDYARHLADRGVGGQLYLKRRSHVHRIDTVPKPLWTSARHAAATSAHAALHEGIDTQSRSSEALLDMLLLGTGREDLGELDDAFAKTGLAHLLAISGLHIGILAVGLWWGTLLLCGRPQAAATVAIAGVLIYLFLVPTRVPIMRAGLMTVFAMAATGHGRRIHPLSLLSVAALILLVWRPWDLFGAGFQLSFTIVAALILLAPLLAARWRGADLLEQSPRWKRWAMDYAAVCLVAWAVALPLVCFHFHKISPLAAILTPLMLPVVAVVLWVGYLKMMLTWIDPAIGNWLGLPLGAMADFLAAAVRRSADLPGVVLYTPPVSVLWWIGTSSVVVAWLCGAFVRRRMACIAAITLCIGWLQAPVLQHALFDRATGWRLHTFAVGNGSAYLIDSDGEHLLYDCGSSSFADLTGGLLDPALRSAGVRTIDTLVLSHPDLDHFSGAIALIERFGVRRVLLTEAFIAEESNDQNLPARTAVGALMRELRRLPVEIQIVAAKRSWQLGHCQLDILWPPAGQTFSQRNDGSIVMSIRGAGRRLLLTGDIQDRAMRSLLGSDQQLHADIMELPHHGSLAAKTGPRWLQTVEPLVAIQSTSMGPRVRNNPWGQYLRDTHLCATARGGAVRLVVDPAGTMDLSRYREQGWKPTGTYTYNKGRYQRPSGADE